MALGVRNSACFRISSDLIEDWRIVGEIEEADKAVQRTRAAIEIIVIMLPTILAAEFQTVISTDVAYNIAKFKCLFRKVSGSCFSLRSAEANSTAVAKHSFNFDSRDAEVCISGRFDFVESKPGEVEARFV